MWRVYVLQLYQKTLRSWYFLSNFVKFFGRAILQNAWERLFLFIKDLYKFCLNIYEIPFQLLYKLD